MNASITIGLPVFNGGDLVVRAVSSILNQTFKEFNLIISDNSSCDGTFERCFDLVKSDPRVTLIKQKENIGAWQNFEFLLTQCNTEFFMWLSHDDMLYPQFLEKNLNFLRENNAFVASVSDCEDFSNKRVLELISKAEKVTRLRAMCCRHENNFMFYSLYRTKILRQVFLSEYPVSKVMRAHDWIIVYAILRHGPINVLLGQNLIEKKISGSASDKCIPDIWSNAVDRRSHIYIPYYSYTRICFQDAINFATIYRLVCLNIVALYKQILRGLIAMFGPGRL